VVFKNALYINFEELLMVAIHPLVSFLYFLRRRIDLINIIHVTYTFDAYISHCALAPLHLSSNHVYLGANLLLRAKYWVPRVALLVLEPLDNPSELHFHEVEGVELRPWPLRLLPRILPK